MTKPNSPTILLVDDTQSVLESLKASVQKCLNSSEAKVEIWMPSGEDGDPVKKLDGLLDKNPVFVATDYDLTSKVKGLFGLTIVARCQQRLIPVGDFSRGNFATLPQEPNLFELRVPNTDEEGASFIVSAFHGFLSVANGLLSSPSIIESKLSLAAVLSALLDKPDLENQFALYMMRLGAANSAILERLKQLSGDHVEIDEKRRLLTYVLGHVLCNSILRYPGPLLSKRSLAAYCATSENDESALAELFSMAKYQGPFGQYTDYYWRDKVDAALEEFSIGMTFDSTASIAQFNRKVVEARLGRVLENHNCGRCSGVDGGFWCPFTQRTVCIREDCSVASSSWIPQGGQLCRVEREFYDEWAPLLGL